MVGQNWNLRYLNWGMESLRIISQGQSCNSWFTLFQHSRSQCEWFYLQPQNPSEAPSLLIFAFFLVPYLQSYLVLSLFSLQLVCMIHLFLKANHWSLWKVDSNVKLDNSNTCLQLLLLVWIREIQSGHIDRNQDMPWCNHTKSVLPHKHRWYQWSFWIH